MNIWDVDRLVLFLAFVVPGSICVKAYELIEPGHYEKTSDKVIDAIAYSCVNYALFLVPIIAVEKSEWKNDWPMVYYLFYLTVLLVGPVLVALFWQFIRTREFFQKRAPHPTGLPWDYLFAQRKRFWMRVTLTNGTVLAGKYADHSFASSAPHKEQLYLEESWILNSSGGFEKKKNRTAGILILSTDVSHIELLNWEH